MLIKQNELWTSIEKILSTKRHIYIYIISRRNITPQHITNHVINLTNHLINEMDNKLLCDHLICRDIDYFHVSIVDMIQVGNNAESLLDKLLSR